MCHSAVDNTTWVLGIKLDGLDDLLLHRDQKPVAFSFFKRHVSKFTLFQLSGCRVTVKGHLHFVDEVVCDGSDVVLIRISDYCEIVGALRLRTIRSLRVVFKLRTDR